MNIEKLIVADTQRKLKADSKRPYQHFTKDGKINANFLKAIAKCGRVGTRIYHSGGYNWGAYRHSEYLTRLMTDYGLSYSLDNDSPRGGIKGDYIEVGIEGIALIDFLTERYPYTNYQRNFVIGKILS